MDYLNFQNSQTAHIVIFFSMVHLTKVIMFVGARVTQITLKNIKIVQSAVLNLKRVDGKHAQKNVKNLYQSQPEQKCRHLHQIQNINEYASQLMNL